MQRRELLGEDAGQRPEDAREGCERTAQVEVGEQGSTLGAVHEDEWPSEARVRCVGQVNGRREVSLLRDAALNCDLMRGVVLVGHDAQHEWTVELGRGR